MIKLSLNSTDAALLLAALQHCAQDCIDASQIDALIDTVQNKIDLAEREADADERDLFPAHAEAPAEDAHLDPYQEGRTADDEHQGCDDDVPEYPF